MDKQINMNSTPGSENPDELMLKLARLNESNAKLMADLKAANTKLEESESLKSHFVSNITNEIINPFTSIIGLSRNILSVKKEDWKKVITMVAMIHSEAFNLDFQLRNIFVAAKIEAGEVYPEISNVDIKQLIHGVIDQFSIEARKKNVRIQFINNLQPGAKDKSYVRTDAEKIKLILANLLSNAVKFSFGSGVVEINCDEDDGNFRLDIKDYGKGITDANRKIIFDRFKRIDSGINSIYRGHGLGLSIIKALLDILEGEIEINSNNGQGTEFCITIPLVESEATDTALSGSEFLFNEMESGEVF